MFKLITKYIKPYIIICAVCICFLFIQVMTELNLPNYLSKIVDEGLQRGGINTTIPNAISKNGLNLLKNFMTEQDKQHIDGVYISFDDVDKEYQKELLETYKNIEKLDGLVLADKLAGEQAEQIMGNSMYAFVDFIKQMSSTSPQNAQPSEQQMQIDLNEVYQGFDKMAQASSQNKEFAAMLENTIKNSKNADEIAVMQTSAAFIKSFYQELGADTDKIQMNSIYKNGIIMLLISLASVVAAICVCFCSSRVGASVARDLRKDVFKKVTMFSDYEFNKFSTASLITRTTNDITQIQMIVTMSLRMLWYAPVMGIGAIIMAVSKSVSMSWIIALAVSILILVVISISIIVLPRIKIIQSLVDKLNLVTREGLSGMFVIRAFDNQKFEEERFDKANVDLTKNNLMVNRITMSLFPIMMLLMNVTTLLVIWVGANKIADSSLMVGDMMAFMQYAMEAIMAFLMISFIFIILPRASVSADRINQVLATKIHIKDEDNAKDIQPNSITADVEFKNVCFKYDGAEENVLSNISLVAKKGETTAFIGSTGSGKTTLVNLLPRFYDITEGEINIGGINIKDIKIDSLRAMIGYVPQKGVLFSGDIASNLRFGDETATEQELLTACDTAQAKEFIQTKPDGLNTEISQGGTNVSGGQRQRLAIARALVKKAPIYIFDDSFSALDFKTDAKLRKALAENTKDATVLLVAQRISTIMNAEKIVVLSDGEVVGIGKHKDLLKTCETYKEIAFSQLSKEELENE